MTIIPVPINDLNGLDLAVDLERTAIIVQNKDLYPELEKKVKKGKKKLITKVASGVATTLAVVAGTTLAVVSGIFFFVPTVVGTAGLMAVASISSALGSKLKKYVYIYDDAGTMILIKKEGTNAFHKKDEIKGMEGVTITW